MTSHGAAVEVTDLEKHAYENKVEPVPDHEGEVQTGSTQVLAKKLKSRHMQMIAIGKHSQALSSYLDRNLTYNRWFHRCRSLRRFRWRSAHRWSSFPRHWFHDHRLHVAVHYAGSR